MKRNKLHSISFVVCMQIYDFYLEWIFLIESRPWSRTSGGGLRAIGAVEWSGEGWRCMGNGSGLQGGGLILLWHALESFKIGSRLCFIKLSDLVIEWCRASLLKDVKLQQVVSDEYHRDRKSFPLYLKVNVGFLGGWGAVLWVYLGLGSWWRAVMYCVSD